MNALNLAKRCADAYLKDPDPALWAGQRKAVADALTMGLSEYWMRAPQYVVSPQSAAGFVLASGTTDYALPLGFQVITRPLRIRPSGTTDQWIALQQTTMDPDTALTGKPRYYQVLPLIPQAPVFDDTDGGDTPDYVIRLYPSADQAYDMDLGVQYQCPVIRGRHLAGKPTVELPITDIDCITNVVPLCGPAFFALPFRKPALTQQGIDAAFLSAERRVAMKPTRMTRTPARVRTPTLY